MKLARAASCRSWRSLLCKAMAKYDPLRDYLRKQKLDEFELTFAEIAYMSLKVLSWMPIPIQPMCNAGPGATPASTPF